jgi:DNA gyrase inhibitor GyrI
LKVRIEVVPEMRVASVRGYGRTPEEEAWRRLRAWAEPEGLWEAGKGATFGFNNPAPRPGESEYGYELWLPVEKSLSADGVEFKQFGGGLFAVTRCVLDEAGAVWRKLWDWAQAGDYRWRKAQELERVSDPEAAEVVMDLYLPVTRCPEG